MNDSKITQAQLDEAFALGACAAYDDLGITEPPWYLANYSEEETNAWKRGLEQGYKDCENWAGGVRG